jgi:alpha-N-arabinofuranosidase
MGRCIYGGIYDPDSPLSDEHGYRKDVLSALRELDVPVIRYPGGNFIATYHWQDAIGPREQRPKRPELAWLGVEPNTFGTDEFMHWLSVLSEGRKDRVEPYLCLNMGTGTLTEALAWVEYCNGTRDTYWANKRRENGHPEPYNVKVPYSTLKTIPCAAPSLTTDPYPHRSTGPLATRSGGRGRLNR